jgi:hypothetical protein
MSRPHSFMQQFSMQLSLLEGAFIKFYADTYGKAERDVIRTMLSRYVNADKGFDPEAFLRFVKKHLLDTIEDLENRAELKRVAEDYAATRAKADGPRLTLSHKS